MSEIENLPEHEHEVVEVKSEYLMCLNLIHGSLIEAARIKGGFTMADCRQLLDSRSILVDYFTLEDGETELSEPSRMEMDALALMIKLLEAQQMTGVFSFEGSVKLIEAVEKLSDALTEKKTPKQRMEDQRRKLKATANKSSKK